jgi:hypothetical protein
MIESFVTSKRGDLSLLGKANFDESNGRDLVSSVSTQHDGFVIENHSDSVPEVTHPPSWMDWAANSNKTIMMILD